MSQATNHSQVRRQRSAMYVFVSVSAALCMCALLAQCNRITHTVSGRAARVRLLGPASLVESLSPERVLDQPLPCAAPLVLLDELLEWSDGALYATTE